MFINYSKKTFLLFLQSFKLDTRTATTALLDALFWLLATLTALVAKNQILTQAYKLELANITPQGLASQALATNTLSLMRGFFINATIVIILALFVIAILYTLSRSCIWLLLLNKKPSKQYFFGFLKLNLTWWLIWLIPAILLFTGLKPHFVAPVLGIAFITYVHFTSLLHSLYNEKKTLAETYITTFNTGKKIHLFIPPYILAFITYWAFFQIFHFIPQDNTKLLFATALFFLIIFLAWFRSFFISFLEFSRFAPSHEKRMRKIEP